MAEYIEREQAYQIAKPIVDYIHSDKYHPVNLGAVIMDMIDDIPSADVQPVVHGHWESQIVYPWKYAKCSECHMTFDVQSNFCPNCGADMRCVLVEETG